VAAAKWTAAQIPDQSGRSAVVTGANSGLGLVIARELARAGASVVMACRNTSKGEQALDRLRAAVPGADARVESLDLADLSSVRAFAERVSGQVGKLDLLVDNAGVMAPPRRETADGFESQFGTNHLGHFALTGLLLAALSAAPAPRVVAMSAGLHRLGRLKFDDLQREQGYNNWLAYGQSKLANLMFCFELQRRATAAGSPLLSLAAHPGYSATHLQFAGPARFYERWVAFAGNMLVAQTADRGALPALYAATVPDLPGATFVGPDGFMESRGYPRVVRAADRAYDEADGRRLWEISEELTGVRYAFPAAAVV
jgi:NAD(P)-dependent dehydrogenase (short-subunit alcohol dehydrogenase family)